jgi:hypothetical protein
MKTYNKSKKVEKKEATMKWVVLILMVVVIAALVFTIVPARAQSSDPFMQFLDKLQSLINETRNSYTATPAPAVQNSAVPTNTVSSSVRPANPGESIAPGTLSVLEVVDHSKKSISITGPVNPNAYDVGTKGTTDYNGWVGYNSAIEASAVMCTQARERLTESWAKGYKVTINGLSVDEACKTSSAQPPAAATAQPPAGAPAASSCDDDHVNTYPAESGKTVPVGWVLEETVRNNSMTIELQVRNLTQPDQARIVGATHFNFWSYCSEQAARTGLSRQMAERVNESQNPDSWNHGYTVTAK